MIASLIPLVAMAIPIVAIVGGITAGIFRTVGQQKIAELAMKERITAIEKGLDPAKLPPVPALARSGDMDLIPQTPREKAMRTAVGLGIGGIITFSAGLGLAILMLALPGSRDGWIAGLVPAAIGLGLCGAALLVRQTAPRPSPPPPPPSAS